MVRAMVRARVRVRVRLGVRGGQGSPASLCTVTAAEQTRDLHASSCISTLSPLVPSRYLRRTSETFTHARRTPTFAGEVSPLLRRA